MKLPRDAHCNSKPCFSQNPGYPICSTSTAATAGAVFGAVASGGITLLGCCAFGCPRSIDIYDSNRNGRTSGTMYAGWCGNRLHVSTSRHETYFEQGWSGQYHGYSDSFTTGTIQRSGCGIGAIWSAAVEGRALGWFTLSSSNQTTTQTTGGGQGIMMT
jgi:hypothetical protein